MWQVVGSVRTPTSVTVAYSGPCAKCGHEPDEHDVVCRSAECPDATSMCMGCVAGASPSEAFHPYTLAPLWVHLS